MNVRAILIGLCIVSSPVFAADPLSCMVGPIHIEIGGGNWQVTSCGDGKSLTFATAAGNPAMPFVFIVLRGKGKTKINGEGNGSKVVSSAAFEEIRAMSEAQFDALVEVTKLVKRSK